MSSNTKNRPDSKKPEEKKDKKLVIILAVVLVVVIIAFVAVVAYLLGRGNKQDANNNTLGRDINGSVRTILDEESAAGVVDEMRQQVEEGMFQCEMSMSWTFNEGSSESQDAYVANNENNTHPIYFDVYLEGSDEPIYSSPIMPVGTNLNNIKLDKELEAGDYRATVMYTLLTDLETQEEISQAGFLINIKVLN
jgi:hypothetical protein